MNGSTQIRLALDIDDAVGPGTNRRGNASGKSVGQRSVDHHRQPIDLPDDFARRIDLNHAIRDHLSKPK